MSINKAQNVSPIALKKNFRSSARCAPFRCSEVHLDKNRWRQTPSNSHSPISEQFGAISGIFEHFYQDGARNPFGGNWRNWCRSRRPLYLFIYSFEKCRRPAIAGEGTEVDTQDRGVNHAEMRNTCRSSILQGT